MLKVTRIVGIVVVVDKQPRIKAPDPGNVLRSPDKIASRIVPDHIFLKDKTHIRIEILRDKISQPAQVELIGVVTGKEVSGQPRVSLELSREADSK